MGVNLELFDIVPTHLAVQAMRDNGYKNAAYAIAELMDNSIQAGATSVELLCCEQEVPLAHRTRRRIHQVAVLDNGSGMDAKVLRMALQFGNGTYLDDRSGIGRFGMGLPSASISQCKRVDVWTWQTAPESAIHTYIDLEQIKKGEQNEVPEPQPGEIPSRWRAVGNGFGESGTLVVWTRLDRCAWKTAASIIRNSELVIGRMYRRFLHDGKVSIRMASFVEDAPTAIEERYALPNDPLYLMMPSSTPDPYDKEPLFQPYGDDWVAKVDIEDLAGETHAVLIRFTYAKEEARQGHNPGERPYGKHAAKNVGVSLMRAGRELELSQAWVIQYDPVERWWGIEVEFPPALDELFGVSNNKQSARNFTDAAELDIEGMLREGKTISQLKEELREEGDPLAALLEVSDRIRANLQVIRKFLRAQTKGGRGRRDRYDPNSAEARATQATKERKEEGYSGSSDTEETLPPEERKKAIETELIEEGVPRQRAEELAVSTVDSGLKYVITHADLETPAFFSVKPRGGAIVVSLNVAHPAYKHLVEVLEEVDGDAEVDELKERLANALKGLKLLLTAWARYEDEQISEKRRAQIQDTRSDWGRVARQFLYRED